MKFKKDIFISYAHIDDESLVEGEAGWISEFHRSLEIRLAQLLGYRPNIWRDRELTGNNDFSDEILSQLPEIAILVSIHSPRYVKSEWCVREVNEFHRVAEKNIGATIGTRSRIFKVIKTPVDLAQHPPIIQGLLGYEFFKVDPETGRIREFSKLFGKEAQLAYWAKLDDLAHDLVALLEDIAKKAGDAAASSGTEQTTVKPAVPETPVPAVKKETKTQRRIYLSETSYDSKEKRESISRLLIDKGFTVLPDKNLPLVIDEYETDVKAMIRECDLSIHIIGSNFGLVPEGTNKSKVQLQNEIAAEISKEKNMPRLIWLSPGAKIEDERQSGFVEELKRSDVLLSGADLLIGPLEDLEFAITDKLTEPKQEVVVEEDVADDPDRPKQIYLICDQADLGATGPVEDFLFNKGFEVILPAFEGDQTELRLDHQENLKTCDAVLIYYGAGNDLWLRSKTRDLLKIAGYGRKKPLTVKTVCVAAPMTPQKERFRSHEVKVMMLPEDNMAALEDFIKDIK
ncbi:MAG: hypothetical protein K0S33_1758 [Bacteroidetes bacterium]|jgi:hypothetical protein|nr:hypothetical protein [Bacteroidota bacterium]